MPGINVAQNHIGLFLPFFFSTLSRSILLHFGPSLPSARLSTHLAMWTHIPSPPSCLRLIVQKDLLSTLPYSLPPFRRILHSLPLTEGRKEGRRPPTYARDTVLLPQTQRGNDEKKRKGGRSLINLTQSRSFFSPRLLRQILYVISKLGEKGGFG